MSRTGSGFFISGAVCCLHFSPHRRLTRISGNPPRKKARQFDRLVAAKFEWVSSKLTVSKLRVAKNKFRVVGGMVNKLNSKFILMAALIIIVLCVPVSSYPDIFYKAYSRFKYGSVLVGDDRKFILKDDFYIFGVKGKSYYLKSLNSEDSGLVVTFGKIDRAELDKYTDNRDIKYLYESVDCIVVNYPRRGGLYSEYVVINFKNSFTLLFSRTIGKMDVDVKEYCELIAEQPYS